MRGPRQVPILEIDRLAVAYETRHGDATAGEETQASE